jgi:hypothetical protein
LGNSFSYQTREFDKNTWMKQVANTLEYNSKNLSSNGTSLDYVYHSFNKIRHEIESNDIIICTVTDTDRRWLFEHNPCDAIWRPLDENLDLYPVVYEEEVKFEPRDPRIVNAVNLYLKHLDNLAAHDAYLQNFLYNLNHFTKIGVRVIILPCFENISNVLNEYKNKFPNLHIADKSIMSISKDEFEGNEFYLSGIMRFNPDPRLNHLTTTNHNIMSQKIINYIKNNEPISFRNGFIKDCLNYHNLRDQDFSKKELFDLNLDEYYEKYSTRQDHIAHADLERRAPLELPR